VLPIFAILRVRLQDGPDSNDELLQFAESGLDCFHLVIVELRDLLKETRTEAVSLVMQRFRGAIVARPQGIFRTLRQFTDRCDFTMNRAESFIGPRIPGE
jgi:hypothetical protein